MDVAICSFDRSGKALQYFQERVDKQFDEKDYANLRGVPHAIAFAPVEGTARVRLVVRDSANGQIGSLNVPYTVPANPPAAVTNNLNPQPGGAPPGKN